MDNINIVSFLQDNLDALEKWNAGGIALSSAIIIVEQIHFLPSSLTPYLVVYIFLSSIFFVIAKERKTVNIPEARCPFCGGEYEVSRYRCKKCKRENG